MPISNNNTFSAVILAGGTSSRMNGISKQQFVLCGIPVVARSMLAFEKCRDCAEILVVSREDECALYDGLCRKYGIRKYIGTVPGGKTRQESAYIGMNALSGKSGYVAFHDAARCLITPGQIEEVYIAARTYGCASACTLATDTVKIVGKDGKTLTSGQPERAFLRYMQTPQIFKTEIYLAAAAKAREEGFTATDDCSLAEYAGFSCKTVDCGRTNIKITTPEDLVIAEALLGARGESEEKA